MFFRKKQPTMPLDQSIITSEHSLAALTGVKDIPLKNVNISSGVTDSLLNSIFIMDLSAYEAFFKAFVQGYYAFDISKKDKEIADKVYSHAIVKNRSDVPLALDTLVKAQQLDGEVGAVVQYAIIYAIAMYISWEHRLPGIEHTVEYAINLPNTRQPNKTSEQHQEDFGVNNLRASVIAWSLCAVNSKDAANEVIGKMDYLLNTCEYNKVETEQELEFRVLEEGKL